MQQLNLIFAVFALVLIRKTLILEESGYNAAVIGGFTRTAWTCSFSWYRNETIFASSYLIGALPYQIHRHVHVHMQSKSRPLSCFAEYGGIYDVCVCMVVNEPDCAVGIRRAFLAAIR